MSISNIEHSILVTGGSSFIGIEIVNQLFSFGECNITVLDSMTKQIHEKDWQNSCLYKSIESKCRFIKDSVCDLETVQDAIKDAEVVFHLATETGTSQSN